ncbi:glucuronyl esterase domain-containing protein [Rubripirellula amarantea]|nr:acetylxylan esterase [Rubripirellula amarantea]
MAQVLIAENDADKDQASAATKVLGAGELPRDARLKDAKTLDDHFPMQVPDNAGQWQTRSEQLRRRVLVATGLWPMPEKTPLNAVVHTKIQRDGFSVEKVYFESLPGHFVTGLLFRPDPDRVQDVEAGTDSSDSPRYPGVLCPHGHGGRNQAYSDAELKSQLEIGAEHFPESGRMPKLARCATLARMGCVTFIFDMLGYGDSNQISFEVAHRHAKARPEESIRTPGRWVMYSADADLRLQSLMGLQTWNLVRAFDFLASLPDVDADRLAVTGGSGGGTQSILLGAIDDRVKVTFPNGMVSTSMQGGCYCENCNYLRVGTGNVELAALVAPKPMAMTAADDWTKDMMTDGYPELRHLYAMIGDEADVYCRPMLHFKHNYNYVTRATMYQWMNKHLELGLGEPVVEQDYVPLTETELVVWDTDHPAPKQSGVEHEQQVCQWFDTQTAKAIASLDAQERRDALGQAWSIIFDVSIPAMVTYERVGSGLHEGMEIERGLLRDEIGEVEIPLLTLRSPEAKGNRVMIWTAKEGKAHSLSHAESRDRIESAIRDGFTVLVPDVLGQGEFTSDGHAWSKQRLVDDDRQYSAFSYAYNRPLAVERCGDLLRVVAHAEQNHHADQGELVLSSSGDSIAWSAAAAAIAGERVDDFQIDGAEFRYEHVNDYSDPMFVPGSVKYGDVDTLLELRSPHKITRIEN